MKVFISYAREDRKHVRDKIAGLLRKAGYKPWFDLELAPGQNWQQGILSAIQECEAFVYVLTPESVASNWCRWELRHAIALKKKIIPLMLRETELPEILKPLHYVDFTKGATAEALAEMIRGLNYIPLNVEHLVVNEPTGTPPQASNEIESEEKQPVGQGKRVDWNIVTGFILAFAAVATVIVGQGGIIALFQPTANPTQAIIAQNTATNLPLPTQSPTEPLPTATTASTSVAVALSPTNTLVPTTQSMPTVSASTNLLYLERSGDSIAVCANSALDLSKLRLNFGQNERYTLGDVFAQAASTQAGTCWCLQQRNPQFPAPAVCTGSNTSVLQRTDWRNATIDISLNGNNLGSCQPQPSNMTIYTCEISAS